MINKIFNWTIGSFFRTLGRILVYIVIGFLVAFILSDKPKAAELEYSYGKYRPQYTGTDSSWGTLVDFGTSSTNNPVEKSLTALSIRMGRTNKFKGNTTYRVIYNVGFSPNLDYNIVKLSSYNGFGSNSLTSWSANASYVNSLKLVNIIKVSGSNTFRFIFDIELSQDIVGFQINMYFDSGLTNSSVNVYSTSSVGEDTSQQEIVNNQTNELINNQNNNTQTIIDNINDNLNNKCNNLFDKSKVLSNQRIGTNGFAFSDSGYFTSDFILVEPNTIYTKNSPLQDAYHRVAFYSSNNESSFISRSENNTFTTPNNAHYIRFSGYMSYLSVVQLVKGDVMTPYCEFGSTTSKLDHFSSSLDHLTDNILDDNISNDSIQNALNFNTNDSSLTPFSSFLLLPLNWVQNILAVNQVCTPISLPLPYINKNLVLPCMRVFWDRLGLLSSLIQAVWLCVVGVRIFNGLFILTVDSISSKDNDDELTKVRSWEL